MCNGWKTKRDPIARVIGGQFNDRRTEGPRFCLETAQWEILGQGPSRSVRERENALSKCDLQNQDGSGSTALFTDP
jgi:hypothetical protein